jgi:isopentenyldiphosphate isomerase
VYVFVFDDRGRLLIQRRSDAKKIGPGQWDLSVAEHLSQGGVLASSMTSSNSCSLALICALTDLLPGAAAGETFHQAATRGLQEELGIAAAVPQQPLGPMHKRSLLIPGRYADNELVQSYRVDGWRGQVSCGVVLPACETPAGVDWLAACNPCLCLCVQVQWNPAEVSEVTFIELGDLRQQMEAEPEKFTQWFREEVQMLGWFGGGAGAELN